MKRIRAKIAVEFPGKYTDHSVYEPTAGRALNGRFTDMQVSDLPADRLDLDE